MEMAHRVQILEQALSSRLLKGDAMKKKDIKKLSLTRETLAQLDPSTLPRAAGGTDETEMTCICPFSYGRRTCDTCDNDTCTSNYC